MTLLGTNGETILDTAGQPVPAHVSAFVRALDRLLTVSAYYADGHDQHLRAIATAAEAMTAAIGARPWLALEVSAAGLIVDGVTVDPRQRGARQVHDLLVALDIANLSFSPRMTAPDLRAALSALQAHRLARHQAHSFRALALEGLPPTVCAANRRLQATGQLGPAATGTDEARTGDQVQAGAELLDVLRRIVSGREPGDRAPDSGQHRPLDLSAEDLEAIRDGVRRLLARDPGAGELSALLGLAAQALELGGAPAAMRLAFAQLSRRVAPSAASTSTPAPRPDEHARSVGDLSRLVADLAARAPAIGDPAVESRRDQVAICFRLLANGARDESFAPALTALEAGCAATRPDPAEAALYAAALRWLATTAAASDIDRALPPLLAGLRAAQPDLPARIWAAVAEEIEPPALSSLWPHLVNDVALGLEPAEPSAIERCCRLAGSLDAAEAVRQAPRFLALPGARRAVVPREVFLLPPQRSFGLHAALLKGAAAARHATNLLRELRRRPPDELTGIVLAALDGVGAVDAGLLLEILREGGRSEASPDFRSFAATLLTDTVEALPAERRGEAWVVSALAWLARNAPNRAGELLNRVDSQRNLLLRPAWPEACRVAARATTPVGGN
ncbi:hypothetical protein FJ250_00850 [bacterium]|nr:hypothetical protein [bacterium]